MKITNFTGKIQLSSIFEPNAPKDKTAAKISQLCKQFKEQDNLIDIVKIFNNDSALKIQNPSTYEMDLYKFIIGSKENLQEYKKTLAMLNKHKLSICPQLEQYTQNKNKQYTLLVLKVPEQEEFMKTFITNKKNIDTLAKCEFVQDLETLAQKNKVYNSLILEDPDSIKITSEGKLYVPDWSYMDRFNSPKEQAEYFNQLRKIFNLIF